MNPYAPLVVVLHGYTGSASGIKNYSEMNAIADLNGFAVCYPQGTIDDFGSTFFNVGYSSINATNVRNIDVYPLINLVDDVFSTERDSWVTNVFIIFGKTVNIIFG